MKHILVLSADYLLSLGGAIAGLWRSGIYDLIGQIQSAPVEAITGVGTTGALMYVIFMLINKVQDAITKNTDAILELPDKIKEALKRD